LTHFKFSFLNDKILNKKITHENNCATSVAQNAFWRLYPFMGSSILFEFAKKSKHHLSSVIAFCRIKQHNSANNI